MLADLSVNEFIEDLSTKSPLPGGGSVAAMCGAAAAALISMVVELTKGREGYESVIDELDTIKNEMVDRRAEFLEMMDKDAQAYADVIECYKLPKNTREEKDLRQSAIQSKILEAALIPLSVAEKACMLFDGAEAVTRKGNKNAVSDGAIAAMMIRNSVLGALYNVRINAMSLKDEKTKKALLERAYVLEKAARKKETAILELLDY
ncbi:MAG: cyclodeaminase/cyclohydrolase family protein [Anaerovoracaceae bacterium]|jgi:formiminotetrahydrofolate cyclodeaminase